jgi:hypothetical protein
MMLVFGIDTPLVRHLLFFLVSILACTLYELLRALLKMFCCLYCVSVTVCSPFWNCSIASFASIKL